MVEFLSDEWVAALDAAARADDGLRIDGELVLEQVVQTSEVGERVYQVRFDSEGASVERGRPAPADVVLVTDRTTAWQLHQGVRQAQDAFAGGDLKVRGRPELLAGRAALFARLEDAWRSVRHATTPAGDGPGCDR